MKRLLTIVITPEGPSELACRWCYGPIIWPKWETCRDIQCIIHWDSVRMLDGLVWR